MQLPTATTAAPFSCLSGISITSHPSNQNFATIKVFLLHHLIENRESWNTEEINSVNLENLYAHPKPEYSFSHSVSW